MSQGPVRRPAGLNSPATRSSAGFVMREIQTGLHKPEGGTKQRLTKSADNSAPVCLPNCALICLGSRVSYDLPLALAAHRARSISAGDHFSNVFTLSAVSVCAFGWARLGAQCGRALHRPTPPPPAPPRSAPYGSHCVPYPAEAQVLSIDITIANCGYHSITQRLVTILEKKNIWVGKYQHWVKYQHLVRV